MKHLLPILAALLLLTACHKDKNDKEEKVATQSVLVYIAGDNNLSSFTSSDIRQMMEGSKELTDDNNLLLFIDQKGKLPYLMKVEKGDTLRIHTYPDEILSSDPATLREALQWMTSNYKARQYGLILWGHADGWTVWDPSADSRLVPDASSDESRPRRAYGLDNGSKTEWMNISDMATTLESVFIDAPLRFIFADCCCFQCVESAYELRHSAQYIIASPAEIPGEGAPYQTVIPALFSQRDDFCQLAIDAYYEQVSGGYQEPMTAIRTSEMENLAQATRTALAQTFQPLTAEGAEYPDVKRLIYFYDQTLFDMNDFLLRHASSDVYAQWHAAFNRAVVYRTWVDAWMANHVYYLGYFGSHLFRDFDVTDERYGGVSMFVPQDPASVPYDFRKNVTSQNARINRMQWYKAAGLDALGWCR